MTIEEWTRARVSFSDGRTLDGTYTLRLEYERSNDWKLTLTGDDLGDGLVGEVYQCVNGTYSAFDKRGNVSARSDEPWRCNGVGRWIHYGFAQHIPWARTVSGNEVTYTSEGERAVFDLVTGLPVLYEATSSRTGVVGQRTIFHLERYGSS